MTDLSDFKCLPCRGEAIPTLKHPRDREQADIVICKDCGHIQMYPLLSIEEEKEEYDTDKSVRFGGNAGDSEFSDMRLKFSELTKEHFKLYYGKLQRFENVLEVGVGYGFFIERCISNITLNIRMPCLLLVLDSPARGKSE
jgi:hypothetical protein